jgi:hypothetical protein
MPRTCAAQPRQYDTHKEFAVFLQCRSCDTNSCVAWIIGRLLLVDATMETHLRSPVTRACDLTQLRASIADYSIMFESLVLRE